MQRSDEIVEGAEREHHVSQESWWLRRNGLYVRNGEMIVIILVALIAGGAATLITAYLGVR